jgi:hypothetical protein
MKKKSTKKEKRGGQKEQIKIEIRLNNNENE